MAVPLRMLWPHIGIRMYLLRRYLRFSRIITDREQAAFLAAPVSPRYGFEVSSRQHVRHSAEYNNATLGHI